MRINAPALALSLLLSLPLTGQQEEMLSLDQAIAAALERNPQHKMALADTHGAKADVKAAQSAYFPQITFSEAATLSNDPVYVFGTRLRQSRFTAADFALNQLNNPEPIGNFATRFGGQWTVFNSLATRFSARRASQLQRAAAEHLARADQVIAYGVIQSYYRALLAEKELELAEHAVETTKAVAEQSRTRVEAGTAVESDLLSAQVELASRRQELVRARNGLALSVAELNVAMGEAADRQYRLTNPLTEAAAPVITLAVAEGQALKQRSDLKEAAAEVKASDAGLSAARSSFGPRLSVFGAWELNNVSPFANGSSNWTAGAELQFDLFSGGQKTAAVSRARASVERTSARKQEAEDQVRLEVRRAYYDFDSARQMLEVSKAAVAQAEEGLRIVSNRYGAGMTTITDLLRADDAARAARINYWDAVYHCLIGYAALQLATGELSQSSMNLPPAVSP